MSANWNSFKSNLISYMSSYSAKNTNDLANKIANEYVKAIKNAEDLVTGNKPLSYNKAIFVTMLKKAFSSAIKINTISASNKAIELAVNSGIVLFWTGATLTSSFHNKPPGFSKWVPPCAVVVPGVCNFKMPPTISSSNPSIPGFSSMPNALALAFKAHLLTLSGIHAIGVRTGDSSPIPSFPWAGMK